MRRQFRQLRPQLLICLWNCHESMFFPPLQIAYLMLQKLQVFQFLSGQPIRSSERH